MKPTRHTNKGYRYAAGGKVDPGNPADDQITVYEIWSRRQGKKVGTATTKEGARRSVDRRDNAYGAYDHYVKGMGH